MTPTQWLAIPTEIRLTEVPKLQQQAEAVEMPAAVLLNGKNVVIKQEEEEEEKFEVEEEVKEATAAAVKKGTTTTTTSLYFYPMGNGLLATTENVAQALSLDQAANSPVATPSTPEASTTADIFIYKSKPKNPDYKVKDSILATKRSRPVSMKLVRVRPGLRVIMWMSYQGHIYGDEPVKRCKKHDECVWCNDHEFNQSFCIISKCHWYELNEKQQPRAILSPSYEHLDQSGGVPFSVVFSCWNSCDNHSRFGKELAFTIQIVDEKDDVVRSMEFSLQCCQNLLRDAFKDRKRKQLLVPENGEESCGAKSVCLLPKEGGQTRQLSPPPPPPPPLRSLKGDRPIDVVVEGLDEERRDIIERMVRVMGGSTYRIPHLARIRSLPSQKNGSAKTSKKVVGQHKTTDRGAKTTCTPTAATPAAPVMCNVRASSPPAGSVRSIAIPVNGDHSSACPVPSTTTTTSTTTSVVSPLMSTITNTKLLEPSCVIKTELNKDGGPVSSKEGPLLMCSKSPVATKIFLRTPPPGAHLGLPAVTTKPVTGPKLVRARPEGIRFKGNSESAQKIRVKIESSWS